MLFRAQGDAAFRVRADLDETLAGIERNVMGEVDPQRMVISATQTIE